MNNYTGLLFLFFIFYFIYNMKIFGQFIFFTILLFKKIRYAVYVILIFSNMGTAKGILFNNKMN